MGQWLKGYWSLFGGGSGDGGIGIHVINLFSTNKTAMKRRALRRGSGVGGGGGSDTGTGTANQFPQLLLFIGS